MAFIIPLSIFPPKATQSVAQRFVGAGDLVYSMFPSLGEDLLQAEIGIGAREYASAAAANATVYAVVAGLMGVILGFRALSIQNPLMLAAFAVFSAAIIAAPVLATIIFYPRIISSRKTRKVEAELIPATRQLLIEIKSGVPLFNAMASVSSDYGEVSVEFQKITRKINSGVHEVNALAEATRLNTSLRFRKVLWQISNALKVGSDVAVALQSILGELEKDKVDQIKKYGAELSPWTMAYMMVAVILPSLGITMLIVISSFMGMGLPKIALLGVLAFLAGFQLFFLNFVGTRRPAI
ncbi:MAG: type II secretion system F family protein [Candidatus Micrarchaeia archaeon]|jgi:flagellar protein FlaJ